MLLKLIAFAKKWTLPLGMLSGVAVYLLFHFCNFLTPLKEAVINISHYIMPFFIFIMLFTTFLRVNPHEMRLCRWHTSLLALQFFCCLLIAVPLHFYPQFAYSVPAQGILICLIAPTGTAAAVIAGRLGGNATSLTIYTILSSLAAAVMIPLVLPLVELHEAGSFTAQFLLIISRVFPLLIVPFLAAWGLRSFFPEFHRRLTQLCGDMAFYLWGISLIIAIGLTLRSVANSHFDTHTLYLLAASGLAACLWQFGAGKFAGRYYGDYIACGQGFGQKNTLLAIWVAYTYLAPVVSIAPSSYILFQNIVNSWQLYQKENGGRL